MDTLCLWFSGSGCLSQYLILNLELDLHAHRMGFVQRSEQMGQEQTSSTSSPLPVIVNVSSRGSQWISCLPPPVKTRISFAFFNLHDAEFHAHAKAQTSNGGSNTLACRCDYTHANVPIGKRGTLALSLTHNGGHTFWPNKIFDVTLLAREAHVRLSLEVEEEEQVPLAYACMHCLPSGHLRVWVCIVHAWGGTCPVYVSKEHQCCR